MITDAVVGVAGIIAPWNYPFQLSIGPAVAALAAGNRVLVKPSELAPRFAEALQEAVTTHFAPDELAVVQGGAELADAVSTDVWTHLDSLRTRTPRQLYGPAFSHGDVALVRLALS